RFVLINIDPWSMTAWPMYRYFPDALALDQRDFLPVARLTALLAAAGFDSVRATLFNRPQPGGLAALLSSASRRHSASQLVAIGGREALGKLTSRHTTGKMTVSTPAGDLPGTIEIFNQAPNLTRTLLTIDLSALGAGTMTVDQRFDGTAGSAVDSMQGPRDITGDQLANMKNADFPTPLLRYKEKGMKIALAGKEKVGDKDA